MITSKRRIALNVRGLAELSCIAALVSLALVAAWWAWQEPIAPTTPVWLMALHRAELVATTALAGFILILAGLLAIAPPTWWLRVDRGPGVPAAHPETPTRWLGEQIQRAIHPAQMPQVDPAMTDASGVPVESSVGVESSTGVTGDGQPSAPAAGPSQPGAVLPATNGARLGQTLPGQPIPGQPVQAFEGQTGQAVVNPAIAGQQPPSQPGQPLAPGEPQPKPAAAPPADGQPSVAPPAPLSSVLNFEEVVDEDDPLAGLGDIKDILSSAFDDDSALDPDREALGRSLDDVNIRTLLRTAHQVRAAFT